MTISLSLSALETLNSHQTQACIVRVTIARYPDVPAKCVSLFVYGRRFVDLHVFALNARDAELALDLPASLGYLSAEDALVICMTVSLFVFSDGAAEFRTCRYTCLMLDLA